MKAAWFWHRLRAMSPSEVRSHLVRRWHQWRDQAGPACDAGLLDSFGGRYPNLPERNSAPPALREAVRRDGSEILRGQWRAFTHLPLHVDDPPIWQKDYWAGVDLTTNRSAYGLNPRALPKGADIKVIWELSRWQALMRLAQQHWLEPSDMETGAKCVGWLEDWCRANPPYRGWNWTSALETGMRLIQFGWLESLLQATPLPNNEARWRALRQQLLPAHVRFTWRYRSFGSSANNHLLGELAGLIIAAVRWPEVTRWVAPIDRLQGIWEGEVMAQFAPDGGNREQALGYQLFAWELCWQTRKALRQAERNISEAVEERLATALRFFVDLQVEPDRWDYGDSDNAHVTPFYIDEREGVSEWRSWALNEPPGAGIRFWCGAPPVEKTPRSRSSCPGAHLFPDTGIYLERRGGWTLRWDLSPLGYLSTAAHGHLDALHLSLWYRGVALVIDPGTAVYYAEPGLRNYLASREAHNGPCPEGLDFPKRRGPFLWGGRHDTPQSDMAGGVLQAKAKVPGGLLRRTISRLDAEKGWAVEDRYDRADNVAFYVHWQFAPGTILKQVNDHAFEVARRGITLRVLAEGEWEFLEAVTEPSRGSANGWRGMTSSKFRKTEWAPYLRLRGTGGGGEKPCLFRTTFLASGAS